VRVPGLIKPDSAWARPFTIGGGSGKGFFFVPDVGSEVAVFFHQGDVDEPHYIAGNWRAPGGNAEVPDPVKQKTAETAYKIKVIETDRWRVVMDDEDSSAALLLLDKRSGNKIEIDGVSRAIAIDATSSISINAVGSVSINALSLTLNGRPVLPSITPI
jgi:uncharacterized protein involved in type VI secretion and phage assembly